MANSKVVSTTSDFSTVDNVVPTHGGGTVVLQKPNADPSSSQEVNGAVSIVSTSQLSIAFGQSITGYYISTGYCNMSLPSFLLLQQICNYAESNSSLTDVSARL